MTRNGILGVAVLVSLSYAFGSCGRDTIRDERDVAYKLANHYRWQRDSTKAAQAKTDTITKVVVRSDARLTAENDSLKAVLQYADSVLRDSTATIPELRIALAVTISRSATFQASALVYRDSVRTLIAAHAKERFSTNKTLAAADSSVVAERKLANAERRDARKKFWRGFVWGGATGVVVTLLAVVL